MKRAIWIFILGLMFSMMILGFIGCRSVKKSQSSETTFSDSTIVEKSHLVDVSKEVNFKSEKSDIVFNPVKVLTDSAFIKEPCPENRVVYRTNGDVEVSGNIKNFTYEKSKLYLKIDTLSELLEKEKRNIKLQTVEKTVVKRKAQLWLLWLLIPAFLGGVYVGVKFKHKIKP